MGSLVAAAVDSPGNTGTHVHGSGAQTGLLDQSARDDDVVAQMDRYLRQNQRRSTPGGYGRRCDLTLARLRTAEEDPGSHSIVERHIGNGEVSGHFDEPVLRVQVD